MIGLSVLLSNIINAEEKNIDCHRKMSREEFISLDVAEKIDIFICRFNYHRGSELEIDNWRDIIKKELKYNNYNITNIYQVLKKHVTDSIIGYTKEIYDKLTKSKNFLKDKDSRKFDYGLQLAWNFIFPLIENNKLSESEINWFIIEYENKLIQYIENYKIINTVVNRYNYMIEKMKDIKYENNLSLKESGRILYEKYSKLGFKNLKIEKSMMFPEYEELKKKYNSSSTTGAISGAGGSS